MNKSNMEIQSIKIENMETMWELQQEVETISKSISTQKLTRVIEKLDGRVDIRKYRGRRYLRGKLRPYTYLSKYYLVPLGGDYFLQIARSKDGSLSMWLYDNRTPDKLGISTLLAYEHQPIIARKLRVLIRYLSRHSQSSKNA